MQYVGVHIDVLPENRTRSLSSAGLDLAAALVAAPPAVATRPRCRQLHGGRPPLSG